MFSQVSVCSQGEVTITCPRSLPEGGYAWSHVLCGVGGYVWRVPGMSRGGVVISGGEYVYGMGTHPPNTKLCLAASCGNMQSEMFRDSGQYSHW